MATNPFNTSDFCIRTYPMGILVNPLALRPDDVHIEDIAHGLANEARFAGHTRERYSVAEHCVRVSWVVPRELALRALLHDASEAYLKDIPRPIKKTPVFGAYRAAELAAEHSIATKFSSGDWNDQPLIKLADMRLCSTEARDLTKRPQGAVQEPLPFHGVIIRPWSSEDARAMYLRRYSDLIIEDLERTGWHPCAGYCRACQGVVVLTKVGVRPLIRGLWKHICSQCGGDFSHQLVTAEAPTEWAALGL